MDVAECIVGLEQIDIDAEIKNHNDLKVYNENSAKLFSLKRQSTLLSNTISQLSKTYNQYLSELDKLKQHKCPHCDQEIHDDKHQEMCYNIEVKLGETKPSIDKNKAELAEIQVEIDEIGDLAPPPSTYYKSLEEALTHQNNIQACLTELDRKANEIDPYQAQIEELETSALQPISWDTVNDLVLVKDHQEFLLKLLTNKDS